MLSRATAVDAIGRAATRRRVRTTPPSRVARASSSSSPQTTPEPSERVRGLENEGAYAVLASAKALELRGAKVAHLEIGQPSYETPANVSRAGIAAIEGGATKYAAANGTDDLRRAVAEYVSRTRGTRVDAEDVVIGPGAKPGLFLPTLAIVEPGDEVVYPDPGFPTYAAMVDVAGGRRVPVKLREDGASFDMAALEAAVNEKTKLIVINSPGNPTGGVMPREDVERVAELAKKFNCYVLSDEIYSRLIYDVEDPDAIFSIISLDGMLERTILVDGFSKTYCMTGWRLGWAVCPPKIAERVKLLTVHSVGCVAAFTQAAGVEALTGPQDSVQIMRDEYRERRDFLVDALNAIPGVQCPKPAGAFYVFPDVSSFGLSSREVASILLNDAHVALLPGTDFGDNGEGKIRLSYVGGGVDELRDAVNRIERALRALR